MSELEVISRFNDRWAMLSNFYPAPVVWEGMMYPTSEHAFIAGKTLDKDIRRKIAAASTPGVAKRLGRMIPLRDNWDAEVSIQVMSEVLRAKFLTHADCRDVLLSTENATLIEGNYWHDQRWGSCFCGKRVTCSTPGDNRLGILLMQLRSDILMSGEY